MLLQLPKEIRAQIFANVIAPGMIHIELREVEEPETQESEQDVSEPKGSEAQESGPQKLEGRTADLLDHRICLISGHETQRYNDWMDMVGGSKSEQHRSSSARHADSGANFAVDGPDDELEQLDLRLLRTCRQIYKECRLVTYQQNAFSFHDLQAFRLFFESRLSEQTDCIKSLHFGITLRRFNEDWFADRLPGADPLSDRASLHMPSPETLNICIDMAFDRKKDFITFRSAGLVAFCHYVGLLQFGGTSDSRVNNLKTATVMLTMDDVLISYIMDNSDVYGSLEEAATRTVKKYTWDQEERREQSRAVQRKLLGPNDGLTPNEEEEKGVQILTAAYNHAVANRHGPPLGPGGSKLHPKDRLAARLLGSLF